MIRYKLYQDNRKNSTRKIGDGSQFSDMPVPLFCRDRLGMAISVFIPTPQRYIFFHVSQNISYKKRIIVNRPRFL